MVEGDIPTGREGELGFELPAVTAPGFIAVAEEISLADGSFESIWNHTYSATSNSSLQFSYSQHRRDDPLNPELRNTYDLDYRHQFAWGRRQDIVWGLGYEDTADRIGGSLTVAMNPPDRAQQLFASFIQDEIALVPERLFLTVGTKLEHNDYTGFEFMPSVRAGWSLSNRNMLWVAVSRALRAPSRNDTNLVLNIGDIAPPGSTPILLRLLGNPNFQDERLIRIGLRAADETRLLTVAGVCGAEVTSVRHLYLPERAPERANRNVYSTTGWLSRWVQAGLCENHRWAYCARLGRNRPWPKHPPGSRRLCFHRRQATRLPQGR